MIQNFWHLKYSRGYKSFYLKGEQHTIKLQHFQFELSSRSQSIKQNGIRLALNPFSPTYRTTINC